MRSSCFSRRKSSTLPGICANGPTPIRSPRSRPAVCGAASARTSRAIAASEMPRRSASARSPAPPPQGDLRSDQTFLIDQPSLPLWVNEHSGRGVYPSLRGPLADFMPPAAPRLADGMFAPGRAGCSRCGVREASDSDSRWAYPACAAGRGNRQSFGAGRRLSGVMTAEFYQGPGESAGRCNV